MDQSMVWLGDNERGVSVEDRVTLIGQDGEQEIKTEEWQEKLKTITYEITCQINSRVKRVYRS